MTDFVNVDITTDSNALLDNALDFIGAQVPGYVPQDGNLEVITLGGVAPMASDAASVAAVLIPAAFRALGTKLFNLPYEGSASATVQSTWVLVGAPGSPIPAGTYVVIDDLGFYVQADTAVSAGNSTVTSVTLVASEAGSSYNNLAGPAALNDQIDWVTSVTLVGLTSGGADAEGDDSYQNRLSGELALQAPRPITASDFAQFTLSVPSTIVPSGVIVGRATAIDGYDPTVATLTATTTNTSATLSAVSSFSGVTAGSVIAGAGIPTGSTVISINTGAATLVMSAAATASHTAESVTSTGSYNNARTVTVFVTDLSGNALSSPAMAAIQAWLASYREINFLVYVVAPSYTTIYVSYSYHPLPGFDTGTLTANINSALTLYLNPGMWGNPSLATGGSSVWLNGQAGFNIVRKNKLVGIIEGITGVDYVPPAGVTLGTSPSPASTSDVTMVGPAPLPVTDLTTPTVIGTVV